MTFTEIRETGPDQATPLSTEILRSMPLIIRSAALVALLALAATIDWSDTRAPDQRADQVTSQADSSSEPVFDGRGKWGGYAR